MAIPREAKVGAFVLSGLAIAAAIIFIIGDNRRLFDVKETYYAVFDNVGGLKPGSPVVMGGVDVGRVSEVRYADDLTDNRVHVGLTIVRDEARRIRDDSVAAVVPKGLLGDQMMEIKPGTPGRPNLPAGSEIKTTAEEGLLGTLNRIGAQAQVVMQNLEKTSGTLADDAFREDLQGALHAVKELLVSLNEGQGYVPKLLHDPKEAATLSNAIDQLGRSGQQLERALSGVNQAIAQVNTGPGLVHEVLYGEGPRHTLEQFGTAAEELALVLSGIRQGNGLARSFIYGDENSQSLMTDLSAMSADLRALSSDLRAGRGTLGALLVDPSVYEDLKTLLGNIERNQTLRALVRYSIKQDEKKQKSVEVGDATSVADK